MKVTNPELGFISANSWDMVRAMSRSRPRMELSEFVARNVAVVLYDVIG